MTAADKARADAEAARKKQDEAAAKQTAQTAQTTADLDKQSEKAADVAAQEKADGSTDAERSLQAREADVAAREAKIDRVLAMLEAQGGAFLPGGAPADQPKSAILASPGAGNDPTAVVNRRDGTTAPAFQPHAIVSAGAATGLDPFEWEEGEVSVWGRDAQGRVIRPREYPQLKEQDVLVTKAVYVGDTVRNPGEILRGYTGPLGSALQPLDNDGKPVLLERFKRPRAA